MALYSHVQGLPQKPAGRSNFTKIYSGSAGTDSYTNAISDVYQDNFEEGIYTGKGIYDLDVFSSVLEEQIPENTVLSHDLIEGSYLRCGLSSDIMLMDGYPTSYAAFKTRLSRWTRGDWQIIRWLKGKIKDKTQQKIKDTTQQMRVPKKPRGYLEIEDEISSVTGGSHG